MSPKSPEQFEEIRQRSAANILQAAMELFAHRGFNGTSISQIAKEAGVSKGLIYNYYESKEALLEAIVMGAFAKAEDILQEQLKTHKTAGEQLEKIITMSFQMVKGNLSYWKLLTSLAFQPGILDRFESILKARSLESLKMVEGLFKAMGRKNPKSEAYLLGAVMDGMALQFMTLKDDYPFDEMLAVTIEKFCQTK